MRKQMIENAAFEVATQVRAVEDLIDATLAEVAELQSRVMHVNAVAGVGPAPIHAALEELSAALRSLVDARGSIVSCHSELADRQGRRCPGCAPSASAMKARARRPQVTPTCASSRNDRSLTGHRRSVSGRASCFASIIFNALLLGSCGYAWFRGRSDERTWRAVCFGASLRDLGRHQFLQHALHEPRDRRPDGRHRDACGIHLRRDALGSLLAAVGERDFS